MKRLIVALTVAWSSAVMAVPADSPIYAMFGGYDCGQWFVPGKRQYAAAWLVGFLSGQSLMYYQLGPHSDPLDELRSADQAYLWMDNWCRANPLEGIDKGGQALFRELTIKRAAR